MKTFILLSILLLFIITISVTANLHAQLIGGSPLWCKINNACGEGPDVGSNEWKHCQAKGGCRN